MIGIRWNSNTSGPCGTCGQAVVTKTKKLLIFGIPIPLGGAKTKCGCAAAGAAQGQPMQGQPAQGQPMQQAQPFPGQPMQQQAQPVAAAPQACTQCGQPVQWSAEHQRSFCGPCQKWY